MSFKKGQSGNLKGKPKGTLSQKTIAWENLGNFITETGAEKVKTILTNAEPEDFIKYYWFVFGIRSLLDRIGTTSTTPSSVHYEYTQHENRRRVNTKKDTRNETHAGGELRDSL